ncbi:hypothetical protein [Pseudoduganella sp. R-43]|uniref:hypothetical protein n=1 Tax=unclassified Pseudoduganella TaxID=2637179 RepID=UPI003CF3392D
MQLLGGILGIIPKVIGGVLGGGASSGAKNAPAQSGNPLANVAHQVLNAVGLNLGNSF